MIVIVVIGILSAIGASSLAGVQANARDSQRKSQTSILASALEKYYSQNGQYPSCADLSKDPNIVVSNTLKGIDPKTFATPKNTSATGNSLLCTSLSAGSTTDNFAYVGNNSPICLNTSGGACNQWSLQYKKETTGDIITITSRHIVTNTALTAPNPPVVTVGIVSSKVTANITPVVCSDGQAQYAIHSRRNDGSWGAYSDWSDITTIQQDPTQGTKYGYQAQARCHSDTPVMSSAVAEGNEATYTTSIDAPIMPAIGQSTDTNLNTMTWSWADALCTAGSPRYRYDYAASNGSDSFDSNWQQYISSPLITTSYEGYSYSLAVQAQCYNSFASSDWSDSSTLYYHRPITTYTLTIVIDVCGGGCQGWGTVSGGGTYNKNSNPTITATPITNYSFSIWGGDSGCSGAASHTITMDSDKTCIASFIPASIPTPAAPIIADPASSNNTTTTWSWNAVSCPGNTAKYQYDYFIGGVSQAPTGWKTPTTDTATSINFTTGGTTSYENQTYTVKVQAKCSNSATSSNWSPDSNSVSYLRPWGIPNLTLSVSPASIISGQSTTVTLTSDRSVSYPYPYYLSIYDQTAGTYLAYTGSGSTLAATPSPTTNHTYIGRVTSGPGSGDILGNSSSATVTVQYALTVTAGTGGTVSGGGTFNYNSTPTIAATASAGYTFGSWSDTNCGATPSAHTVTMTSNLNCTASFTPIPVPAPAAPTLTISQIGGTMTKWSWADVTCSAGTTVGYQFFYSIDGTTQLDWQAPTPQTPPYVSFTTGGSSTFEDRTYTVKVRAKCHNTATNTDSIWVESTPANYFRPYSISLSVSSANIFAGQSTTLTLTSSVDVGPTKYYLKIYDQTSSTYIASAGSGSTLTYADSPLSNHTYIGQLTDYLGTIYNSTGAITVNVSALPAPTGLTATADLSGKITVGWNSVNITGATYRVDYYIPGTDTSAFSKNVSGTSDATTGFTAGSTYPIKVYTVLNSSTSGPASTSAIMPVPAPTGVTAVADSSSQITVSWTSIGISGATYRIDYDLSAMAQGTISNNTSSTSNTIAGLYAGKNYPIKVYAIVNSITSAASSASATTPIPAPSAPTISVGSSTSTNTTYSWGPGTTGCPTNTTIQYHYNLSYDTNPVYTSPGANGPETSYSPGTSLQGYAYTVTVSALCYTALVNSSSSGSNSATYIRPVNPPSGATWSIRKTPVPTGQTSYVAVGATTVTGCYTASQPQLRVLAQGDIYMGNYNWSGDPNNSGSGWYSGKANPSTNHYTDVGGWLAGNWFEASDAEPNKVELAATSVSNPWATNTKWGIIVNLKCVNMDHRDRYSNTGGDSGTTGGAGSVWGWTTTLSYP